ncbi:MAG: hypothetical protein ACE149_00030 [Armatimonadota bacterium]
MIRRRGQWLAVIAVGAAVALAPQLRETARFQWVTLPRQFERVPVPGEDPPRRDPIMDWANSYRARATAFAEARFPRDSRMLMAAGELSPDRSAGLRLLERVAEQSADVVILSAYVDAVLEQGPYYETPATLGVDPQRLGEMKAARRELRKRRLPPRLTEAQVAPLLGALSRWRKADPGNALPLAVEVWCLNGLGRRDEAMARWQEAARLSVVDDYTAERAAATRQLLARMGLPTPEAILAAEAALAAPSFAALNSAGRIAYHEGRRAQLAGRATEALGCWQATILLGRHIQQCAGLTPEYALGAQLEAFGAGPAWSFVAGRAGGPLGGQYFFGPQHAFYRAQVGGKADAELRDALVRTKARAAMVERYRSIVGFSEAYTRAGELLLFGQLTVGFLVAAGLAAAGVAAIGRRGPRTPALASPWMLLASMPALLGLAVAGGVCVALARDCAVAPLRVARGQDLLVGVGVAAAGTLVAPLIVALAIRRRDRSRAMVWLESLGRGLPVVVAVAALVYLGLSIGAADLRARWVRQKLQSGSEMEQVRRGIGPRWDSPPIFPGSYVEGYPPPP